jgi:uncharacterized protein YjbI with pentapeptide repeats
MPPQQQLTFISSWLVREIAALGTDVQEFVLPFVEPRSCGHAVSCTAECHRISRRTDDRSAMTHAMGARRTIADWHPVSRRSTMAVSGATQREKHRAGRPRWLTASWAIAMVLAASLHVSAALAQEIAGHDRLTREQVVAAVAASHGTRPDLASKDLSGLDLSGVDFRGANLSATVFNRSNLRGAQLAGCNLTVSFGEGADFRHANLKGAEMFSMQLAGADLREADLSSARLIGDLSHARLEGAILRNLRAGADMRNQSMGLMNARLKSARLDHADLTGADLSRADLSFAHLADAKLTGAKLIGADLSGADLTGADLSSADLSGSTLIDTNFTSATLSAAHFSGSTWRNVQGMAEAAARGAIGVPPEAR